LDWGEKASRDFTAGVEVLAYCEGGVVGHLQLDFGELAREAGEEVADLDQGIGG
jgi:hypothetical protein